MAADLILDTLAGRLSLPALTKPACALDLAGCPEPECAFA
jgi:hypothetical protein